METAVFRFTDNYAPTPGTIELHKRVIEEKGFVWYGVFGIALSDKNIDLIMNNKQKRVLLVKSKTMDCYWCSIEEIVKETPDANYIPEYYRNDTGRAKTWLKITNIDETNNEILKKCIVKSTKKELINSINKGMSSYFIVDIK